MAEVVETGSGFGPKLRSRKDGAAIALDDLDKRLLNLMQGSFPIDPRPYAAVASAASPPAGGEPGISAVVSSALSAIGPHPSRGR